MSERNVAVLDRVTDCEPDAPRLAHLTPAEAIAYADCQLALAIGSGVFNATGLEAWAVQYTQRNGEQ